MSREAGTWNKITRVKSGGAHLYVPKDQLELALKGAGLEKGEVDLEARMYPTKSNWRGKAQIVIRLRAVPRTDKSYVAPAEVSLDAF